MYISMRVGASVGEDVINDHLYFDHVIHFKYCFQNCLVMEINNGWQ